MEDSSDDSDICEGSRNVQSVLVKSRISQEELDDYAYKRRLGDLIFDANFEAGNLGFVENVDRYEYDLMVRPDVLNTKHRIWFNFKISNQRQNQVSLSAAKLTEWIYCCQPTIQINVECFRTCPVRDTYIRKYI